MRLKSSFLAVSSVFVCFTVLAALGHGARAGSAPGEGEAPCRKLRTACESAGFTKGGHKKGNKGLFKDCMNKLKNGATVAGVNVSTEDVNACKERMKKRRAESGH